MDPGDPSEIPRPAEVVPLVELKGVSKWYGNVIGLNDLSLNLRAGVVGLLGPNGAGKSTLLQLLTGQLRPSQGDMRVLGQRPWSNPSLNRYVGLCPEQDAFYEWMTGWEFVYNLARLSGLSRREASRATAESIELVGMTEHSRRPIRGYSKGMRQRTKLAQALVHDPDVLFLDEPLTGTDPVARHELMQTIIGLGRRGKSVVVSSHVLYEVQAMTPYIVLLNRGRLVAEGHVRQIRDLIDQHPHRIVLVSENYRRLAARLIEFDDCIGVELKPKERTAIVETHEPDTFYGRLPDLASQPDLSIEEMYCDDDSLEAVFKYLVK
jgi:ABC-2 type transport system ATP-binding protein